LAYGGPSIGLCITAYAVFNAFLLFFAVYRLFPSAPRNTDAIDRRFTHKPTLLFRLFHYPPGWSAGDGVGEHSDYGLLTLLAQDRRGGLEVRHGEVWIAVPPREGLLVVNIGDMLDRATGGRWRSTPHRVVNNGAADRISWPLFFDPAFDAVIEPLVKTDPGQLRDVRRWDGIDPGTFDGTYGDYLLRKVGNVFPQLSSKIES